MEKASNKYMGTHRPKGSKKVFLDKLFLFSTGLLLLVVTLGLCIGYLTSNNTSVLEVVLLPTAKLLIFLSFSGIVCSAVGIVRKKPIKLILGLYLLIFLYSFTVSVWAVGLDSTNFLG